LADPIAIASPASAQRKKRHPAASEAKRLLNQMISRLNWIDFEPRRQN
jgi:hypothetical protein